MAIILRDISKEFGEQLIVSHLSLEVANGELFVLLGASGSGKSTVLRIIAGLLQPNQGSVELHGKDVTALPPQKRGTGFVFQNYAIFKHMTVAENVEFGLKIRGMPAGERRRRSEQLLDLVGLSGLGDRRSGQLSGGQRQRVALARALAYEPSVLLLDEPFGALDVKIRAQLRRSLKEIQRQLDITTILVTHDQEEAFELADRIGVIERGRLIEVGTPEGLYHRPKTEFVATFIGGGNVLVGRAENGRIRLGTTLLPFPAEAAPQEDGAPVRILFRPETVHVQSEPFGEPGVITIGQGRTIERTFAGSSERLRLELETLQVTRPLEPALAYGQRYATIEVQQPACALPAPEETQDGLLWVGLSKFHVLAPTGLKLLACLADYDKTRASLYTAKEIHSASHGTLSVLSFTPGRITDESRRELSAACGDLLKGVDFHYETKIRSGPFERELIREAQEGFYDLVSLTQPADNDLQRAVRALRQRLLYSLGVPVLLVSKPSLTFRRVIICTAAGEPGKSDVRFGARLARHTKSFTTVFHVLREDVTDEQKLRVERHLELAQETLAAFGLSSEVKTAEGGRLEGILKEVKDGGYDLAVVGASTKGAKGNPSMPDVADRILEETGCPVLTVAPLESFQ